MCVKLAGVGLNVCECAGEGREPSWETGVIMQLCGKGAVESLLFGFVGAANFYANGNMCNLAPF